MGGWDPRMAVPMTRTCGTLWEANVILPRDEFPLRYKYCVRDGFGAALPEYGPDKELTLDMTARKQPSMIVVSDNHFRVRRRESSRGGGERGGWWWWGTCIGEG